ncbi:hypothetical protein [Anaerosolibacter sp.]|uniref:hypothetical protein n=1 Tax=Anaerosolibacter sp. TaxID=1872527 RepID=UPI0039F13AF0
MGAKKNQDINMIIKKTAQQTVQEVIKEFEKAKMLNTDGINYFQKTEKLLYNYKKLIIAVEQKQEEIEYIQHHGLHEKSKSIVFFSTAGGARGLDKTVEVIESYKASKDKTQMLVDRIEKAVGEIKKDNYYFIIEAKYFDKKTNEEILKEFSISDSTLRRHKNRLINDVQTILFGADCLEI